MIFKIFNSLLLLSLANAASATVIYDEAVDGDMNQEYFSLDSGASVVTGSRTSLSTIVYDPDYRVINEDDGDLIFFSLTPDQILQSISITASFSAASTSDTDSHVTAFSLYFCDDRDCVGDFDLDAETLFHYQRPDVEELIANPIGSSPNLVDMEDITGSYYQDDIFRWGETQYYALYIRFASVGYIAGRDISDGILSDDSVDYTITFDVDGPSPVPLPAAAWLFVSGLLGLIAATRRLH